MLYFLSVHNYNNVNYAKGKNILEIMGGCMRLIAEFLSYLLMIQNTSSIILSRIACKSEYNNSISAS